MRLHLNYACFLVPVALQLILAPSPVTTAATRKCGSIYKGFAQCLMALGDSMSTSTQKEESTQEIDTICRSWDEFHTCASAVLAGCPDEAAAVWESLRQESKKMQFSGNLYDMCASRAQPSTTAQSPPGQEETNQESLKSHAHIPGHAHILFLPTCLSLLILLVTM
ncbi:hypothetical protein AGOR_G00168520 [Albula goreensis]|uniref:Neuritin-like protein n=1 Tax=Albula goreensis TaxID=1534307 RepID=A0A8T3D1X1_9TELE|nr:hypothetical protein AGOR_G00168520 [Albula goreensis]